MSRLPTGTITFLFADVENNAQLWENYPEAMQHAVSRLDSIISHNVSTFNGSLVKPRGEGESLMVVFKTPLSALKATCAIQSDCISEPWGENTLLRLRCALYTGEAELRDGDYFGTVVNRAARLRAITHPGQVVLGETTYQEVVTCLPSDFQLKDLGIHRLKDLETPEHIWQLLHPGLPEEFPRLLSTQLHNLPPPSTNFVGREHVLAEIREHLSGAQLLTLTGTGGCGKTRLSLQVAQEWLDRTRDGVWFIELAPIANPSLVPRTVAQVLGIKDQPGKSVTDTVLDALSRSNVILMLDNCEHLIEACVLFVRQIVNQCPQVRILASSREPLGLVGEIVYRVPSLSVPKLNAPLEEAQQSEAVALFHDRAVQQDPNFQLSRENIASVVQICHRLDGIPLAIELAAARIRSLEAQVIATRLDNRFRLLSGGSRTSLPRQQTLRALIDWSYDLLHEEERSLLCRTSVFTGGWTLEAMEQVCSGDDILPEEIKPLLSSLIDKSLVMPDERDGKTRYRLLETVRQYGLDKLMERGEGILLRERHRDHYLQLSVKSAPLLLGSEQATALYSLEAEHDNIRRALEWCLGDMEGAHQSLQFGANLWRFWMMHAHLFEGRAYLKEALEQVSADRASPDFANTLIGAGVLAWCQGDPEEASEYLKESLQLLRALGDKQGEASALNNLGLVVMEQGEYTVARQLHEEALAIRRAIQHEGGIHVSLNNLGNLAFFTGDYPNAWRYYQESLELRRRMGDKQNMSHSLYNMGLVAERQERNEEACRLIEESLALRRDIDDRHTIGFSLNALGDLALARGDYNTSARYLQESVHLFETVGDKRGLAEVWITLGNLALAQKHEQAALASYRESLIYLRTLNNKWSIARILDSFFNLYVAQQNWLVAVPIAAHTLFMRHSMGAPRSEREENDFTQKLAEVQKNLSTEEFQHLSEQGRLMSMEHILDFASQPEPN
ncbi:MAG: tetratricopeptide repeat protein [Armatimonadetes bacterium]|nr:tetratricopeptide repeat protein [Armatimonadota bacterium]